MKPIIIKSFIFGLFFLFILKCSYADEGQITKASYVVGVENCVKYPQYSVRNNEFVGKYRMILDKFAEDNNIEFKYVPYKGQELFYQFINDKIDFKFPDNPLNRVSEKAKYKVIYSNYIYHYIKGFFVNKEQLGQSLKSYKSIGCIEELLSSINTYKDENNKINVIKTASCAELIPLLENGTISAILCEYDIMKYLLNGTKYIDTILFDSSLPYEDDYYYVSTIKHPDVIKLFNKWLGKNRNYIRQVINDEDIQ